MVKIGEVQDIVDTVIGSVQFPQIHQEVKPVQLRDPTATHREDLQGGHLLSEHSKQFVLL